MGNSLHRILLFILATTLFSSINAWAKVNRKPFDISITGKREFLSGLQKRAELKMARSTAYCRGFYMPKPVGDWSCKPTGPGVSTCQSQYKCHVTTKNFNRSSEVRRIKRGLSKERVSKVPLKIKVSRKAYKKRFYKKRKLIKKKIIPKTKMAKVKKRKKIRAPKPKLAKKVVPKIKAPKKVVSKKTIDEELDELSDFNEGDKLDKALVKTGEEEEINSGLEDDFDDELEVIEDSNSGKKKKDSPNAGGTAAVFKSFSFDIIQASDETDSLITMGASWTPRKKLTSSWGLRGQFGFKSLQIFSGTSREETFYVYELGMFVDYNFNSNWYGELGYVIDKWGNEAGDSLGALSFGGGYIFADKVFSFIDRFLIDYTAFSNEALNSELKFSLGLEF